MTRRRAKPEPRPSVPTAAPLRKAIENSLVVLMMLARHSPGPAQTRVATRAAGELLWALGIESFDYEGRTFHAMPPEGPTIEAESTKQLPRSSA